MAYGGDLQYLSFGNIAVGIEFLGACTDNHPFEQPGLSKARFKSGIDTYMAQVDSRYQDYNHFNLNCSGTPTSPYYLYKHPRCGMAHIIRPQGAIGFCSRNEAQQDGYSHLEKFPDGSKIVMTAEDFYDDFEKACDLLIADLPNKTGSKFTGVYLPVGDFPPKEATST